jgi:hypothetical protein
VRSKVSALQNMKNAIKATLRSLAPSLTGRWLARRAERHGERFMESTGVGKLAEDFAARYGNSVRLGEFTGMRLLDRSVGSAFLPKLVGSYEAELQPYLRRAATQDWDAVIDIGCAEGFYAVGLAMLFKECQKVFAFDLTPTARQLCKDLAGLNGVGSKVSIHGACDSKRLVEMADGKRCFVISDCEGFESELFTTETLESLRKSELVIELHERESPGCTTALSQLFQATHSVELVPAIPRLPDDYADLMMFTDPQARQLAVNEFRSQQQHWLVAIPKG